MKTLLRCLLLSSIGFAAHAHEPMTQEAIETLVTEMSDSTAGSSGSLELNYRGVQMYLLSDSQHNRMRIIAPIAAIADLSAEQIQAAMESNFHRALDARYAASDGVLFAAFIHPLSSLEREQVSSAVVQVATLASTFGNEYSSGKLNFSAPRIPSRGAQPEPAADVAPQSPTQVEPASEVRAREAAPSPAKPAAEPTTKQAPEQTPKQTPAQQEPAQKAPINGPDSSSEVEDKPGDKLEKASGQPVAPEPKPSDPAQSIPEPAQAVPPTPADTEASQTQNPEPLTAPAAVQPAENTQKASQPARENPIPEAEATLKKLKPRAPKSRTGSKPVLESDIEVETEVEPAPQPKPDLQQDNDLDKDPLDEKPAAAS